MNAPYMSYPTFRTKYYWKIKKMLDAESDEEIDKAAQDLNEIEAMYPFYKNRSDIDFKAMEWFDEDY
jgi:hypothetical protein